MTDKELRDHFASSAIGGAAFTFRPHGLWNWFRWSLGISYDSPGLEHKRLAENAYHLADAMMNERTVVRGGITIHVDQFPEMPAMATSGASGQNVEVDRAKPLCDERLAGGSNPADAGP